MSDLKARIDSALKNNALNNESIIHKNDVIICCKAEIERLESELKIYSDAIDNCDGGHLCHCSISFPPKDKQ